MRSSFYLACKLAKHWHSLRGIKLVISGKKRLRGCLLIYNKIGDCRSADQRNACKVVSSVSRRTICGVNLVCETYTGSAFGILLGIERSDEIISACILVPFIAFLIFANIASKSHF